MAYSPILSPARSCVAIGELPNVIARGYTEHGSINTPLELAICNEIDQARAFGKKVRPLRERAARSTTRNATRPHDAGDLLAVEVVPQIEGQHRQQARRTHEDMGLLSRS